MDRRGWRSKHTVQTVDPVIAKSIEEMRTKYGVKNLGAAGYCFGAKYVCRFLKPGRIDAGYCAHPSFVDKEELEAIEGPLAISAAGEWSTASSGPGEAAWSTRRALTGSRRNRSDLPRGEAARVRGHPQEGEQPVPDFPLQRRRARLRGARRHEQEGDAAGQGAGIPAGRPLVRRVCQKAVVVSALWPRASAQAAEGV